MGVIDLDALHRSQPPWVLLTSTPSLRPTQLGGDHRGDRGDHVHLVMATAWTTHS